MQDTRQPHSLLSLAIFLFFLLNILNTQNTFATGKKAKKSCGCPFDNVELDESFYNEAIFNPDEKPTFPGGEIALQRYTHRLIQNPAKNAADSSKYNVFCFFIVEKDGQITRPQILHHSDSIFEQESLRLISTMPKWTPGKVNNEDVRSWHGINLYFGYPKK